MARGRTYQVDRPLVRSHGEAVNALGLEIAYNGRPDPSGDIVVRRRLVGHPARLEVPGRNTRTHLVHPQRPRHQREYPSMVDS